MASADLHGWLRQDDRCYFAHIRRRLGFTLVELLVVIGIIAVLIGILIPVIGRVRETANRTKCKSNLRQIVGAMIVYSQEFGEFPRVSYNDASGGVSISSLFCKAFSGHDSDEPFSGSGGAATTTAGANNTRPATNDVTAALFLLIRTQKIPTSLFICPSSNDVADDLNGELATKRSNFTARNNLSYSVAIPYPLAYVLGTGKAQTGYYYGSDMQAGLPIIADLNPGDSGTPKVYELTLASPESDMRQGNSRNHVRKGQNVAYRDGRVEWVDTPFAGVNRDNIYTRSASDPAPTDQASDTTDSFGTLPPQSAFDSILLPTETAPALLATDIKAY